MTMNFLGDSMEIRHGFTFSLISCSFVFIMKFSRFLSTYDCVKNQLDTLRFVSS